MADHALEHCARAHSIAKGRAVTPSVLGPDRPSEVDKIGAAQVPAMAPVGPSSSPAPVDKKSLRSAQFLPICSLARPRKHKDFATESLPSRSHKLVLCRQPAPNDLFASTPPEKVCPTCTFGSWVARRVLGPHGGEPHGARLGAYRRCGGGTTFVPPPSAGKCIGTFSPQAHFHHILF